MWFEPIYGLLVTLLIDGVIVLDENSKGNYHEEYCIKGVESRNRGLNGDIRRLKDKFGNSCPEIVFKNIQSYIDAHNERCKFDYGYSMIKLEPDVEEYIMIILEACVKENEKFNNGESQRYQKIIDEIKINKAKQIQANKEKQIQNEKKYRARKKHLSRTAIIVTIAMALIILIFICQNQIIKDDIKTGFSEILDPVLTDYLISEETKNNSGIYINHYARETELKKIDYQLTKIKKEKERYILSVEIHLECNKINIDENTKYLVAHEVEWQLLNADNSKYLSDIQIGKYNCSFSPRYDLNYMSVNLITVFVNDELILYPIPNNRD